jgi:uncharacterized protein YbjT (DUF2867 family)/tryptophan-rich sensory protein
MASTKPILLTGATGYIGGRLLKELEAQGRRVRGLARHPGFLHPRLAASTELVQGDALEPATLGHALEGVDTSYYLVHSMHGGAGFREKDREAARNFGQAARTAGVRRIVYLGGLGNEKQPLSDHLRSRHEVGDVLRASGVPTIEFRASIIIGSGSLSFELIRALVERLPAMITPRWVDVVAQPIAVTDVLGYLVAALDVPEGGDRTFEIGGADRVSYRGIMREYARQRGLRRWMISVPVLTPKLSSLWLGLVTPLYAGIGRILIDSIRHETTVRDAAALEVFAICPMGIREAIAVALRNEDHEFAQTRWSDSLSTASPKRDWGGTRFGNRLVDTRTITVAAPPEAAFAPIRRIGGRSGWYYANGLWTLRGWLDLLVGGVGMRRGRRDPERLLPGDVVDCWRVEAIEPPRHLRLAAEMKLPGRAWLEFEVQAGSSGTQLRQTALFDPLGLWGLAYWYGVWPLHQLVFAGMLRGIARAAEERNETMSGESRRIGKSSDGQQGTPPRENPAVIPASGVRGYLGLFGWLLVCFTAASLGGLFMPGEWYAALKKPAWNPPGWIFGPVWTALYTMMAVAAWLVWRRGGFVSQRGPLTFFLVQLALNAGWTPLFFGLHWPGIAFAEITLLWLAIAATLAAFRGVSRAASWLFAPYLAWVTFAAGLNFALWRLNS